MSDWLDIWYANERMLLCVVSRATPTVRGLSQIVPLVVSDEEATAACMAFADERRMLVEPACGAALAVLRRPEFR